MNTLQLSKSEDTTLVKKEENPLITKLQKKTTTRSKVLPITSREDTEKILTALKVKMAIEEKQKGINKFIIQLILFLSIGLYFIYFYVKNFY